MKPPIKLFFLFPICIFIFFSCNKEIKKVQKYKLDISISPENGGEVYPSSGIFDAGIVLKLEAKAHPGYNFVEWTGDVEGNERSVSLLMDENKHANAIFKKIDNSEIVSLRLKNLRDSLLPYVVSEKIHFEVEGVRADNSTIDLSQIIQIISEDEKFNILKDNTVVARKSGGFTLKFIYDDLSINYSGWTKSFEEAPIDPLLRQTNEGLRIPVVILRIMPTEDGLTLNEKIGPDSYWDYNYPTLDIVKQKFNDDNIITKQAMEYGTRFRDYGSGTVNPYIYFDVIKQFDIYEFNLLPNGDLKTLDFRTIFQQINMGNLVNNFGVKEVWVCHFHKFAWNSVVKNGDDDPNTYWSIEESNMSSPFTGDISNSNRNNNDLPIYKSTYVVYAHYGTAGVEDNLHVRGHQIEAQIYYLDKTHLTIGRRKYLFSDLFVGSGNAPNNLPLGRVGMTHFPPNTTQDYDYGNKVKVESDIMNWIPAGGKKDFVNVDTWMKVSYPFSHTSRFTQKCGDEQCVVDYNNDPHYKWMLFWFQSIPGMNNQIPFEYNGITHTLSNWWDLYYNWDEATKNNKTLWID